MSGRAVMEMVEKGITPRAIMTRQALENATTVLSAIGGSLNAMLHIPALAFELGLDFGWDDIAAITSRTPLLTDIVPNGNKTCIDLYRAGGIQALMKELEGYLHRDPFEVVQVIISSFIGMFLVASGLMGFMFKDLNWPMRLVCIAGGLCLIIPGTVTDLMGLGVLVVMIVIQKFLMKEHAVA